jgi:hypothetical protein
MTVHVDGILLYAAIETTFHPRAGGVPLRRDDCLRFARFFNQMSDCVLPDKMHPGDLGMCPDTKMVEGDLGMEPDRRAG